MGLFSDYFNPFSKKAWRNTKDLYTFEDGAWGDLGGAIKDYPGDLYGELSGKTAEREEKEAALNAARIQAELGHRALDLQEGIYEQSREDMMPWLETGKRNLGTLEGMMDRGEFDGGEFEFGPEDYQESPYAKFLQKEGQRGIERSASARGGLASGATLAGLQNRAMDISSRDYQNQRDFGYQNFLGNYGRKQDKYNRRANMAGMGQTQASTLGQLGGRYGEQAGQGMTGIGNVMAAGQIGASNAATNRRNNLWNMGTQLGSAYLMGSDRRLKRNIKKVGKFKDFTSYLFQYNWSPEWFIGGMADEIKKVRPDAVENINGYDHVNYGVL